MSATATVDIFVDATQVVAATAAVQWAISPPMMAAFLQNTIEPFLRQRARQRFASEGDDVVGSWEQLTTDTQKIRSDMGYPPAHPINVRSGALREFVTESNGFTAMDPDGASMIYPGVNPWGGELFDKMTTAQKGRPSGPTTPARPVLAVGKTDLEFLIVQLAGWINMAMRGGGATAGGGAGA